MHWARRAAYRAACTAGRSRAIKMAMIAMTTSSSMRVNARRLILSMPTPDISKDEFWDPLNRAAMDD